MPSLLGATLISAGSDQSVALAPIQGASATATGPPGLWVWGRVGPQVVPSPVCVVGEHMLSDACVQAVAATEFYTWAVASVAAPADAD